MRRVTRSIAVLAVTFSCAGALAYPYLPRRSPRYAIPIFSGPSRVPTCSGFVIAPCLIATAAHCVSEGAANPRALDHVLDGDRRDIDVTDVFVDLRYSIRFDGAASYDFAIALLAEPTTAPSLPLYRGEMAELEGAPVVASGFGARDGSYHESHARYFSVDAALFGTVGGAQCHGDSGGPIVARHRDGDFVVGISSSTGSPLGVCDARALNTRIDSVLSLARELIATLGAPQGDRCRPARAAERRPPGSDARGRRP